MVNDFSHPHANSLPPLGEEGEKKPRGPWRIAQGLTGILAFLLILGGLGLLPLYLTSAPRFFLVEGNEVLKAKEIKNQVLFDPEQSWFSLDAYILSSQLLSHPWIKSATIHKTPSLGLVAQIEEYRPIAYYRAGTRLFLLSSNHKLLPMRQGKTPWDLPVLSDRANPNLQAGMRPDFFHLERGLRLLHLLKNFAPLPLSAISEIRLQDPLDIQVITVMGGKLIHFGDRDWPKKLTRLKKALPQIAKRFKQIEQIDLRNFQGVAIKLTAR